MAKKGHHPNSTKNLKPAWKAGDASPNPEGRPRSAAGATLREWINILVEKGEVEIRAVIADKDSPAAKVIAARRVLNAMLDSSLWKESKPDKNTGETEMYRMGESPGPALDFDRIMDRTEGKPKQTSDMNVTGTIGIVRVQRGERQFQRKS